MASPTALRGAVAYEFRMQLRKWSLWIVMAVLIGIEIVTAGDQFPSNLPAGTPLRQVMGDWALTFNLFAPIGVGTLLADRLIRDRKLGVAALLDGLPAGRGTRLWGKYLGTLAASAIPIIVAMLGAGCYEVVHRGSAAALGWALLAFAGIALPGLAFVAAFALLVPMAISAPLFRVLFIGYWFWGDLVNPDILPTLNGSLLTPVGDYAASGLFGTDRFSASWPGPLPFLRPHLSVGAGIAEIALLAGVTVLVLLAGQWSLTRRLHS
jgi:ABC-type transport system involved in multi-copper enzyme maturation permease subunit